MFVSQDNWMTKNKWPVSKYQTTKVQAQTRLLKSDSFYFLFAPGVPNKWIPVRNYYRCLNEISVSLPTLNHTGPVRVVCVTNCIYSCCFLYGCTVILKHFDLIDGSSECWRCPTCFLSSRASSKCQRHKSQFTHGHRHKRWFIFRFMSSDKRALWRGGSRPSPAHLLTTKKWEVWRAVRVWEGFLPSKQ